jgi:hypothetical protein
VAFGEKVAEQVALHGVTVGHISWGMRTGVRLSGYCADRDANQRDPSWAVPGGSVASDSHGSS